MEMIPGQIKSNLPILAPHKRGARHRDRPAPRENS